MRKSRDDLLSESLVKAVKKGSILADVMLGKAFLSNSDSSRNIRKDKVYQSSADRVVKACPVCKLTWESIRVGSQGETNRTIYYNNIPRYGKSIVTCAKCSEKDSDG